MTMRSKLRGLLPRLCSPGLVHDVHGIQRFAGSWRVAPSLRQPTALLRSSAFRKSCQLLYFPRGKASLVSHPSQFVGDAHFKSSDSTDTATRIVTQRSQGRGDGNTFAWDHLFWFWTGLAATTYTYVLRERSAHCSAAPVFGVDEHHRHLNKQGVVKIATLINALVDMDYFTEEEEQELFEHAVMLVLDKIEEILPAPIMRLVLETDFEDGVDDEMAETMRARLLEYVKRNVSLPYLDSTDEARVMAAVCAVIVESMKKGRQFDQVVEPVNSGELIIDVFVKGSVGILDSGNKKEFVESICDDLHVPFVPERLVAWVVGMMVDALGEVFEESILWVYQRRVSQAYDWAGERVRDARDSPEWEALKRRNPGGNWWFSRPASAREVVMEGPQFVTGQFFMEGKLVLPEEADSGVKYGEEVRDTLVDKLNERIDVIGWMGDKFEEWEGVFIRKIVDLTLMQGMDMDKMDGSVAYLQKENFIAALKHEWYEAFKEEQLPFPKRRRQDEWYWELANEFCDMDVARMPPKPKETPESQATRSFGMKKRKTGKIPSE